MLQRVVARLAVLTRNCAEKKSCPDTALIRHMDYNARLAQLTYQIDSTFVCFEDWYFNSEHTNNGGIHALDGILELSGLAYPPLRKRDHECV